MAGLSTNRARRVWRLLLAADALIVAVFFVTAATEPYHVLESNQIEIHNFQGLLPTVIVVALRGTVLAVERRLLAARAAWYVAVARLVSLIGFYYLAHWLFFRAHGRWQEVVLGGVLGYALVGAAAAGGAVLVHSLAELSATRAARPSGPGREHPGRVPATPPLGATPQPATQPASARVLTRESLFGLVGVFQGTAGLILGVDDLTRVAVAVLIGAAAVLGIALLLHSRPH